MERERRARLADIMSAMAGGDDAMIVALMHEFRPELERAVRFHARNVSSRPITSADVNSLVADYAMTISDVAHSWRADGGSLPWTYATARLRQVTLDFLVAPDVDLGFVGDDIADEGSVVLGGLADEGEHFETLVEMSESVPGLDEIVTRLAGASGRHVEIALTYRLQQLQGDEHASANVAEWFQTNPDNVRQITRRVFARLDDLDLDAIMVR